ncbi:MAG: hypothetical protein J6X62_04500 [Bacteroidales bacterium]|nr:hypothetical protein [Bacteroidales bacterium]
MLKHCIIVVLMLASTCCAWGQNEGNPNINHDELTWTSWSGSKKIYLWGRVYVVKPGEKADLDVRIVKDPKELPDLHIMITNESYYYPKQWHFVSSKEEANFSVRFVDKDEQLSVKFVSKDEWKEWWP